MQEGTSDPDVEIPLVNVLAKAAAMGATTFVHHTFFGPGGTVTPKALDAPRFFPDFTFGTHLADVEVDQRTGKVTLLNYIASLRGPSINRPRWMGDIRRSRPSHRQPCLKR